MKKALALFSILVFILSIELTGKPADPSALLREFFASHGENWRIRKTPAGTARALFGQSSTGRQNSLDSAQHFLRDSSDLLGIDRISDLRLKNMEETADGADMEYQQYFGGLPVKGGDVALHLDRNHRVIAASSNYQRNLRPGPTSIANADLARAAAIRFARDPEAQTSRPELWIVPSANVARPAWRVLTSPSDITQGASLLYVDAEQPNRILRVHRASADAEGQGSIYPENIIVTPARIMGAFKYMDGSTALNGNFVRTYNGNYREWYFNNISAFTTASDPGRRYEYPDDDSRFSEAMAYFHINRVHDQWRSFGFNKLNKKMPVFVNVVTRTGNRFDNAFYSRRSNTVTGEIVMGSGEKLNNFGQDGDVYYHEYGHAVLDHVKPDFFLSVENNYPFAFHEGFSDISASAITGNPKLAEFALRTKSDGKFVGRNIENHNRYPQNAIYPALKKTEAHHTGLIVGGSWWDLQKTLGLPAAQRILYRSLPLIPNEMTFFDLRDAMLTADQRASAGANAAAIQDAFAKHGLGGDDPGQPGSVTITAIKTALFSIVDNRLRLQFKTKFKAGDDIWVMANYRGTNLTPGYNLVAEKFEMTGPGPSQGVYGYLDEVGNGNRTGINGALQGDVFLDDSVVKGKYTITVQSRLGGTNVLLPEKSVSFTVD